MREKAGEDLFTIACEDRFGVELHSLHLKFAMTQRHDFAVVALSRDFETRRNRVSLYNQRMVSTRFKWVWQIRKKHASVVADFGRLAVHETSGADHIAAVRFCDALMSEADAENGNM